MTGDADSKTLTFCVEHHSVLLLSMGMCYCYCFSESNLKPRHIDMKRTAQLSWLFRSDLKGLLSLLKGNCSSHGKWLTIHLLLLGGVYWARSNDF